MLLATILQFDTVINPARLWDMFREHLCDELKRRLQREGILEHPTQDDIYDYGLYLLGNVLKDNDSQDYLNTPRCRDRIVIGILFYNIRSVSYDLIMEHGFATEPTPGLKGNGGHLMKSIVTTAVQNPIPNTHIFFLPGAAGTDEMHLYNALFQEICRNGDIVLCAASSGIVSLLPASGRSTLSLQDPSKLY